MVAFSEGSWVWMPHPTEGWLQVQLLSNTPPTVTARSILDEHFTFPSSSLASLNPVHPSSLPTSSTSSSTPPPTVDNLTDLEELSEGSILHALRTRYAANQIYTNISSILLSINPYKLLPYYGPSVIQHYHSALTSHTPVPPHIYTLTHTAYQQLTSSHTPQSIIIAGESGAGKTESTKLVLQYLADISGAGDAIEQQILEANPIIEAFGNAKTLKNNNSSRFGKFIEILFSQQYKIIGSRISQYLLEKSRVVTQAEGESNFHIFYALIEGCDEEERKKYHFQNGAKSFKILRQGQGAEIPLSLVKKAMNVLHFSPIHQDSIFRVLAAILHLGNLEFIISNGAKSEVIIENPSVLTIIAQLLSIDKDKLSRSLLTRRLLVGGEIITQIHSIEQCQEMQFSICKAFYDSLFVFLIDHINQTLLPSTIKNENPTSPPSPHTRWIGVLDIFGFENFSHNYWEQLCINLANEKLQQHFISICLSMDQQEYKAEGITHLPEIHFIDNVACLELIEAKRGGIMDMISEEIKLPKGSDMNLLSRMHTAFSGGGGGGGGGANSMKGGPAAHYVKPKTSKPEFTVKHYAGDVTYQVAGFMDKNKGDVLSEDVYEAMDSSTEPFITQLLYANKPNMSSSPPSLHPPPTPQRKSSTGGGAGAGGGGGRLTSGGRVVIRRPLKDLSSDHS